MSITQPQVDSSRDAMGRINAEAESSGLLEDAREAKSESLAAEELRPVEAAYKDIFLMQVAAKRAQVDSIEDRLESLIERQTSRLQQIRSQQPGLLARGGTKQKWQDQVRAMESTMQRLHHRLEEVREIKDGMGPHGSKLESLATAKVAFLAPDISKDWFSVQEAQRAHQAMIRKKEQEQRQEQQGNTRKGAGMSLVLSVGRDK